MATIGPILSGSVTATAVFLIADSYVPQSAKPTIDYQVMAYLLGNEPNPAPTAQFSQSGVPMLFAGPGSFPSDQVSAPYLAVGIGSEDLGAPSATGQTFITASALGQSVTVTGNIYRATEISAASGSALDGPSGLTFTSTGAVEATSGTPDLAINVSSPSSFLAPGGIVETDVPIYQVNPSTFLNAVTTLPVSSICAQASPVSFILRAQNGLLVKLQMFSLWGTSLTPSSCVWTDMFAVYEVASNTGEFAY